MQQGLAEGNHTVTVTLELDDSLYSVNGTQSAVITITKKSEDTSDTTNTGMTMEPIRVRMVVQKRERQYQWK